MSLLQLSKNKKATSVIDADALRIILELQRQNILMKRAIEDASLMLAARKKHLVLQYEDLNEAGLLLKRVYQILDDLKDKDQLAPKPNDTQHGADQLP